MTGTVSKPAEGLHFEEIRLRGYPVGGHVQTVRDEYERIYGKKPAEPGGWYHDDDWHRISYIFDILDRGGRILDVGVGAGQFLNTLGISGGFESVVGLDRITFKKYVELTAGFTMQTGSVDELPFDDGTFDVVTCMEVLEHVPDEVFLKGMDELRRVCRGQLLMTVPYREPEPIYKGHVRRFEAEDVLRCFPDGHYTLLARPRMPWMLVEERFDGRPFTQPGELVQLQTQVDALQKQLQELRGRKALRAANWVGRRARRVRSVVRKLRG